LTKWIIGSAAVGTVGVVTTVIALNSGEESTNKKTDSPKEISQNTPVLSPEEESNKETERAVKKENTYKANQQETNSTEQFEDILPETKPLTNEYKQNEETVIGSDRPVESIKQDKVTPTDNNKKETGEKAEPKRAPVDKKEDQKETVPSVKHPENTEVAVFADLEAKVTKFPNVFTPNNDNDNDIYFVKVKNIKDFQLVIIDQNNREMFRSNTPGEVEGWNGRDKSGDEAPSGSYAAIVTGKDQNGKSFRDIQLFELRR
jgi:gliding motility-associated-like protein